MADHAGFLADIIEHPDDDAPRLIYADWLDDHGDSARAELIRLQIEAARLPEFDSRACNLDVLAEAILAEHEAEWLGEWSERLVRWTFRRGFLNAVAITPGQFIQHSEELPQQFPALKLQFVRTASDPVHSFTAWNLSIGSWIKHIRSLEDSAHNLMYLLSVNLPSLREVIFSYGSSRFGGPISRQILSSVSGFANLKSLETLDISASSGGGLGDAVVELLGASVFVSSLRSLTLDGHHLRDEGAIRLASDPRFGKLERLRLAECGEMTSIGLHALLHSPNLTRLRDLCLSGNIDPRAIADSPMAYHLERLDLWPAGQRITFSPAAWEAFGRSPRLQRLAHLGLANGILGPDGAMFLRADASLPGLRSLSVWYDRDSGDAILAALASRPRPERMTSLELVHCAVSAQGIRTLASSPLLSGLRKLRITFDRLPSGSLEELLASSLLSQGLTWLDLAGWDLRGGGFQLLARCPRLASLTHLNLKNCGLDAEGMAALLASPFLRRLTALHLGSERSSEALHLLASSSGLPRLHELVIGSDADTDALDALRRRFGARLIVYPEQG